MQEAIRQLCLATLPLGISNSIYTLSPNPHPLVIERPEGKVIRRRSWAAPASCDLGGVGAFHSFRQAARNSDVLHLWFPWPFADLLYHSLPSAPPAVLTYVSDVVRQRLLGKLYAPVMRRTLERVKVIVANCPSYANTSPVLNDPALRHKVRVIPLGIAEESYPKIGDDSILSRLGLERDEPYVLFVGVLRYYKGLHTLLKAAKEIKARIVIAGAGPEEKSLKDLATESGVRNVIFAGHVSDEEKVGLLRQCRLLVLPSHLRSEAFGMVLVEAAIFGKPMVTCEIGTGTSYVNFHGESGLVVPPESCRELADAINTILGDVGLASTFGRGARHRYERLFSGPALGRAYAELFQEVAG